MLRLNTHALLELTPEEIQQVYARTGDKLQFENRRKSVICADGSIATITVKTPIVVNETFLKLDTMIETKKGPMTLDMFWQSDIEHLRCQATFRESSSWNGVLGLHKDFRPYLFDNGSRTKYVLPHREFERRVVDAWTSRLTKMSIEAVLDHWTSPLKLMNSTDRQRVLEWVAGITAVGKKELKEALSEAKKSWADEEIQEANGKLIASIEAEGKTSIIYDPADLPEILRKVEDAVLTDIGNDLVLTHTQGLVTVAEKRPTTVREVVREKNNDDSNGQLGLLIGRFGQHELGLRVMASCTFLKYDKHNVLVEVPVPAKLIHTMLEVSHKRALALVAIIEHPAIKEDGTIVTGEGFDADTGIYVRVADELVPTLPDRITPEMAAESYRWLSEVALADFPFASDLDRSGAVAMILTAVQRRLMTGGEGSPTFATSAPIQASGKTALVRLMAYLVLGVGLPVTSWPANDEEMGKHLLAILMEGLPIVLFDNLPEGGRIESDELARACTSEKYRRRILGENKEGEAPTNVVFCFTGNNIQPVGDFSTRTITIYLDPNDDSPETRTFSRHDLETWALEHRAEFFYNVMLILVGHRRCALSHQLVFGTHNMFGCDPTRFHDWDLQVREPLIWAGAPDPAQLFDRNKSEDPQKVARMVLLEEWFARYGSTCVQLKQVLKECEVHDHAQSKTDLGEAISDIVPLGRLTSKSLATVLQRFVNQPLGHYCLRKAEQSPNSKSAAKWYVERRLDAPKG
jgi:hypothetical protein